MTASLAALLEAAGLSGRGGAGFSTAVKVRAAATEGRVARRQRLRRRVRRGKRRVRRRVPPERARPRRRMVGRQWQFGMRQVAVAGRRIDCAPLGWTSCQYRTGTSRRRRALSSPWPTEGWLGR
jgi:hypothetical protein